MVAKNEEKNRQNIGKKSIKIGDNIQEKKN